MLRSSNVCYRSSARDHSYNGRSGPEPKMESTLWMLGVYKSVVSALDFITGATPAGAPDGYTTLQTRSQAHSASNPLLELPAATTWDQGMRASRKEMLAPPLRPSATAVIAVAPWPSAPHLPGCRSLQEAFAWANALQPNGRMTRKRGSPKETLHRRL